MRFILSVLCFLALATAANANYIYHAQSGYFQWNGSGTYYARAYSPGYYSCGTYYYPQYSYYAVNYQPPYVAPAALVVAKPFSRVEFIAGLAKEKIESLELFSDLAKLGYGPQFGTPWPAGLPQSFYQNAPGYSPYTTASGYISYGNASTQYVTPSVAFFSKAYDPSTTELFQMAAQLTGQAQTFSFGALGKFQDSVVAEGQGRQRVAEILAKGKAATDLVLALQSGTEVKGISFSITSGGKIQQQVDQSALDPKEKQTLFLGLKNLVEAKCLACHNSTTKKGGFDIDSYPGMSQAQKQSVWDRITTTDNARMMPRDASGGPGTPLTAAEKRLFFLN